jgi:hypothetical protein
MKTNNCIGVPEKRTLNCRICRSAPLTPVPPRMALINLSFPFRAAKNYHKPSIQLVLVGYELASTASDGHDTVIDTGDLNVLLAPKSDHKFVAAIVANFG